jgi:spore maturation protein CgeB
MMRIFCAVRHSNDPRYYYGGLWSGNFYPALHQLGHEILESKTDLLPTSRFMHIASGFTPQELEIRARITEQILDEVRAAHRKQPLDLFLSYFYNAHFDPAGFDELRALGISSVNFYCNSIYQFANVADIAAKVEYAWHPEKNARELYLQVGANPVWVQMAADPEVYRPLPDVPKNSSACFVGQRYADRDRWMASLIRANLPIEIYGQGWGDEPNRSVEKLPNSTAAYLGRVQHRPGTVSSYLDSTRWLISNDGVFAGVARFVRQIRYRQATHKLSPLFMSSARGPISFEKISEIFAAHDVVLNFSNVWSDGRPGSKLIPHVRLRDFEAPMCRTCYLTGYSEEIEEFYKLGEEIDTYHDSEELVDKTKFYLANPTAAEHLRTAGHVRARRDHTWVCRFRELLAKIDLRSLNHAITSLANSRVTARSISAIIATRNRAPSLSKTIDSLLRQEVVPAEFIIVDASNDVATKKVVDKFAQRVEPSATVRWIPAETVGAAAQRNQGVSAATQNAIWFFDDDIAFEPHCVERLWQALQSDPNIGGVNAMITNQNYGTPGAVSRFIFRLMNGESESTYAGQVIGPAINLLPEDRPDLPEVVPVGWLNTTCTIYRREALPDPPFPARFTGYSLMEDVALSLQVGKKWKLANARTARIFHDSQSADYKSEHRLLSCMELRNRHFVMTQVLGRYTMIDHLKLASWELFSVISVATRRGNWGSVPSILGGKLSGAWQILFGKPLC